MARVAVTHLGASTEEAEENCAVMIVDRRRDFLERGTIRHSVNFPDVEMSRGSPNRLAIANANVPNMLGQISTALANSGLNIHDMVNKSRGELAYTLVDVDSPVPAAVVRAIAAIDGVLSLRLLPERADLESRRGAPRSMPARQLRSRRRMSLSGRGAKSWTGRGTLRASRRTGRACRR